MLSEVPKIVAGLMTVAALGASLLNGVEPTQCILRGGIAYLVGSIAGTIWNLFFIQGPSKPAAPIRRVVEESPESTVSEESKKAA